MLLISLLLLAGAPPAPSAPAAKSIYIEQISVVAARKRMEALKQIAAKQEEARKAVAVNQLPPDLQQSAEEKEGELVSRTSPSSTLTADVLRAWNQIRSRGQTPTPDLIASEIGPDRLAEFLATAPAAASVLATGTLPEDDTGKNPNSPQIVLPPDG